MSENVILALTTLAATLVTTIAGAIVAIIRGNQDAARDRVTSTAERGEMGRDIKEIHKQTNSAYEAVTTKADEREKANNARNDERFKALEELFRSTMDKAQTPQAPAAPVSVNPVTGDPSTPVHVTNVPEDPLHVVDAAEKGKKA